MDSVVKSIDKKLRELSPIAAECSIYRVPSRLLHINSAAYTPQVISIGPLHHGRRDLMAMEDHKLRCFYSFLCRNSLTVEAAVRETRSWEMRARNCYAESINMSSDEFVTMMLVDGCSLVELMMRYCGLFPPIEDELDPLFNRALNIDLYRDFTMLENQLPFFVLQGLSDLQSARSPFSFLQVAHHFFRNGLIKRFGFHQEVFNLPVRHLLDFLRFYYVPSAPVVEGISRSGKLLLPPTATELHDAGVVFKAATDHKTIADITFEDGVLRIPHFEIDDTSETHLRNLIAFEHYHVRNQNVIPYVVFLDGLINTEKDVSLLMEAKIITHYVGSNEIVAKLFNDLCKDVTVRGTSYFTGISAGLHEHTRVRRHRWMASLRRDYFNTPWAAVSFFAAAFLILLTFLQTVFSAVSLSK